MKNLAIAKERNALHQWNAHNVEQAAYAGEDCKRRPFRRREALHGIVFRQVPLPLNFPALEEAKDARRDSSVQRECGCREQSEYFDFRAFVRMAAFAAHVFGENVCEKDDQQRRWYDGHMKDELLRKRVVIVHATSPKSANMSSAVSSMARIMASTLGGQGISKVTAKYEKHWANPTKILIFMRIPPTITFGMRGVPTGSRMLGRF